MNNIKNYVLKPRLKLVQESISTQQDDILEHNSPETTLNITLYEANEDTFSMHFLIPWTGGAFAQLGPFLCPTTEEKKWPIAPKSGPWDLYIE